MPNTRFGSLLLNASRIDIVEVKSIKIFRVEFPGYDSNDSICTDIGQRARAERMSRLKTGELDRADLFGWFNWYKIRGAREGFKELCSI